MAGCPNEVEGNYFSDRIDIQAGKVAPIEIKQKKQGLYYIAATYDYSACLSEE
jgi:hypothetical protein